ncbi:MAG: hypothetical protein V8Q90_04695 [Bacilli bacterium]
MKKSNLSFLMGYLKKHIALLIISIICSLLASLLTLYIPYVVGQNIDVGIGQDQVDMQKILFNCLLILIISAIIIAIVIFFRCYQHKNLL